MFNLMLKQGWIPTPPDELQGMDLKVEFVSLMAKAQKLLGAANVERMTTFAINMAAQTQDMTILDKLDIDQTIDEYAAILGLKANMIRSDEAVAEMREQRAQAQQQALQAENLKKQAAAAKSLSGADMSGDNALTRMADLAAA
jgi:hypothetical protein